MRPINAVQWARSTGIGPAGQAFIQRWIELFDVLTVDTYRVRHLNLRLAVDELVAVIGDFKQIGTDSVNVREVAAEVVRFLKEDLVVGNLLPYHQRYYPALLQPLIRDDMVHPGVEVLSAQLKATLDQRYRIAVIERLEQIINAGDTNTTLALTAVLASDLIGEGYDLRHLAFRAQVFLQPPAAAFGQKLTTFLNGFRLPVVSHYTTFFRLDFRNAEDAGQMPQDLSGLVVSDAVAEAVTAPALNLTKPGPRLRFARCPTDAADPFAAARRASSVVSAALDLFQFTRPGAGIRLIPTCLVIPPAGAQLTVPITIELLGPMRVAEEELQARAQQVQAINGHPGIDRTDKDRLALGLQYLRRGLTDTTARSQFLNLWIGFESLLAGGGRGAITDMKRYASRIVALGYPRRILADLRANLGRLHINLGDTLTAAVIHEPNVTTALVALADALRQPDVRDAMTAAAAAAGSPLLQHRINSVSTTIATKASVKSAIDRNEQDVLWHVQRMYRIRNAIVHGGYVPEDLTHVGSHLATYLWAVLRMSIGELAAQPNLRELRRVFEKYSWLYEEQIRLLNDAAAALQFDVLVEPQRLWPV